MCPYLSFIFFSCYGDHLDLHSFPTRRSSDLFAKARYLSRELPRTACCNVATVSGAQACASPRTRKDRKSTRLNSSHRCISYAVFCLKKKKKRKYGDKQNQNKTQYEQYNQNDD